MSIPESSPAATLAFDALVNRALAKRVADTPYPRNAETTAEADAPKQETQKIPPKAQAA